MSLDYDCKLRYGTIVYDLVETEYFKDIWYSQRFTTHLDAGTTILGPPDCSYEVTLIDIICETIKINHIIPNIPELCPSLTDIERLLHSLGQNQNVVGWYYCVTKNDGTCYTTPVVIEISTQ